MIINDDQAQSSEEKVMASILLERLGKTTKQVIQTSQYAVRRTQASSFAATQTCHI
jgi:hypothetical protein